MYGEKHKALRLHYNYTQTYIEAKAGIRQNTYSQIERDICETKDQTIEKIAKLYNLSLEDLMQRDIHDLLPKKMQNESHHSERMFNLLSEELKQKNDLITKLVSLIPPPRKVFEE